MGYLWSALGVGLLFMSMTLLRFTEWHLSDRTKIIVGASVASAMAIGVLVWTNNLWLVGMLMIVIGGGHGSLHSDRMGYRARADASNDGGARPRTL